MRDKASIRIVKSYLNMGLTKSMSSNHKQAMVLCDRSLPIIESLIAKHDKEETNLPEETPSITSMIRHSKNLLFKYWLKRATLLKRSSSFKESYETLLDLEARIRQHLETVEQGSSDYKDTY